MSFYVYADSTGDLKSINNVSHAGELPSGLSEVELVPVSEFHTVWNPVTKTLESNGGDRFVTTGEIYKRFTDTQRFEFHGSTQVQRVKDAFSTYSDLDRKIWLDHPAFDTLFLNDLVSATDMPSFTDSDKDVIKA